MKHRNVNALLGLDETVKSEIDWVTTARAGIEQAIGCATIFVLTGAWSLIFTLSPFYLNYSVNFML